MKFSVLRSLCKALSKVIIKCPIILKQRFGAKFVTSFSREKCKIDKTKFIGFQTMSSSEETCINISKVIYELGIFEVLYAHREREAKAGKGLPQSVAVAVTFVFCQYQFYLLYLKAKWTSTVK